VHGVNHDWVLWVLVTASALHVVEEHHMGWQGWAAQVLARRIGMAPTWSDFWATNGLLMFFGVSAAVVGWRAPAFALAYPALCLVNAAFFHILPSATARRPNPGFFTAVFLYVPIGIWAYVAASSDGVLAAGTLLLSLALGAIAMALAIAFLVMQRRFRYPDAEAPARG
jgi:hypothetical protein